MAESKKRAEEFEINPDGADLDGTAEIERQQSERGSGSETGPAASQPTTSPAADQREKRDREARDKAQ
jgi:hypothetical protein